MAVGSLRLSVTALAVGMSAALAAPAHADKKSGTLNVALQQTYATIDSILYPSGEVQIMDRAIHDQLVALDSDTGKIVPGLAASWKQIDPTTWEFVLRDDVTFHDGQKLTAEDVAYTVNYVVDPKEKFANKRRFTWMTGAEVLAPNVVRIRTETPYAPALSTLAIIMGILPKHIHSKLDNKTLYGQSPVGTGPYKAVQVDKNKGVILERNSAFAHFTAENPKPNIGRVHLISIPDEQTTVAKMLVGEIDLARVFSSDLAADIAKNPAFKSTATNSFRFYYMTLDAVNRSGLKALSDVRVRRAIAHAVDRETIRKSVIAGGDKVLALNAPCLPLQTGCVVSNEPYAYDPAKAKALLAEAGFADGLEMAITLIREGRTVGEAVAGYLREVGIKASIRQTTSNVFLKERSDGLANATLGIYGAGGIADVAIIMGWGFEDSPNDYSRDAEIKKLAAAAERSFDAKEREDHYRRIFDRNNEQVYILPLASAPTELLHTKDLDIPRDFSTNAFGADLSALNWK